MEPNTKPFEIRSATAEDKACIAEIDRGQETLATDVARGQIECVEEEVVQGCERFVATVDGLVVGYGDFQPAWWTGQPEIFAMNLRVNPLYSQQGIGTELFQRMRSRLLVQGATRILVWLPGESEVSLRFATRLGFEETGQVIQEYHLPIAEANPSLYAGLEARLERECICIVSLNEHRGTDARFLRDLQRVWADAGAEQPDPDSLAPSFEVWQQQVLQMPGMSPDTCWVALEGERPIGLTFLKRLSETSLENDYTGVASAYRGRGIATALKLRAITWAKQNGVERFVTSSEVNNDPMIALNTKLGYLPGSQRCEVALDL